MSVHLSATVTAVVYNVSLFQTPPRPFFSTDYHSLPDRHLNLIWFAVSVALPKLGAGSSLATPPQSPLAGLPFLPWGPCTHSSRQQPPTPPCSKLYFMKPWESAPLSSECLGPIPLFSSHFRHLCSLCPLFSLGNFCAAGILFSDGHLPSTYHHITWSCFSYGTNPSPSQSACPRR